MLVATFGPSTGWAGKTITREDEACILEEHGPISAQDVMQYDRQGHLVWADQALRAQVHQLAAEQSQSSSASAGGGRTYATRRSAR